MKKCKCGKAVANSLAGIATLFVAASAMLGLIGCGKKAEASSDQAVFEGHRLGETPMIWSIAENSLSSDPLEMCKEIVKTGVDAASDQYKKCQNFVLTGEYIVQMRDWKTNRQEYFVFAGWKLLRIAIQRSNDLATIRNELTTTYGNPVGEDHWRVSNGARVQIWSGVSLDGEDKNASLIVIDANPDERGAH
jgi:hypothetical protein